MYFNFKVYLLNFLAVFFLSSTLFPPPNLNLEYSVESEYDSKIDYLPIAFTIKDFVGFKDFLGFFESGSKSSLVDKINLMMNNKNYEKMRKVLIKKHTNNYSATKLKNYIELYKYK